MVSCLVTKILHSIFSTRKKLWNISGIRIYEMGYEEFWSSFNLATHSLLQSGFSLRTTNRPPNSDLQHWIHLKQASVACQLKLFQPTRESPALIVCSQKWHSYNRTVMLIDSRDLITIVSRSTFVFLKTIPIIERWRFWYIVKYTHSTVFRFITWYTNWIIILRNVLFSCQWHVAFETAEVSHVECLIFSYRILFQKDQL